MIVKEILKIQPTEENPVVVENYPYGFKRTQIRYWVESVKKKGDRFVSQTLNPKTNQWNKPKKSTYQAVIVVYRNEKDYITYNGLYGGTDAEEYKAFIKFKGDLSLNELQEEQLKVIRAYIKAYENVEFKCVESTHWTDEQHEEFNKKQEKEKKIINKSVGYHYSTDNGGLN